MINYQLIFYRCTHYKVTGCNGKVILYFNPISTILSAIIIWAFVIWCIVQPDQSNKYLGKVRDWITDVWTWLYVGTQDVWAVFIIVLYFSKYSNLKLGEFSYFLLVGLHPSQK